VIVPHLPAEGIRRRIIEAILYLDRTGCAWRYLPADFPPWQTVCTWPGCTPRFVPRSGSRPGAQFSPPPR
jgi:transposase